MPNNNNKKDISFIHDRYFRTMMADKRVAQEFFQAHLPAKILSIADNGRAAYPHSTDISRFI